MKLRVVPLVLAALVTGCGATSVSSPPTTTTGSHAWQSPSPTAVPGPAAPTSSARPAADSGDLRFTWSEVPFHGSVSAITGDGSRFVAVGTGSDGVSSWTSGDGGAWEEYPVPERSFGPLGDGSGRELLAEMGQLVRLGDTLYSFGGIHIMDSATGVGWRWTDGNEWELIESESGFFAGGITHVTAGGGALFGINSGFTGGPLLSPSTWLWTPASSWVQTPLISSEDAEITVDASAWGNGTFIAAGSSAPKVEGVQPWDWPRTPSMWTSPDGRAWTAIQPPAGMSTVCSLTTRPDDGFVALGTTGDRAASWTSTDGVEWVEGTIGRPGGPGVRADEQDAVPCNVAAFDGGLLASAQVDGATLTWTSRDGGSWFFDQRLDIVGVHQFRMAALGDDVLLFGNRVDPEAESGFRGVLLRGTVSPAPYSALEIGSSVRPTVEGLRLQDSPGPTGAVSSTMPLDAVGAVALGPLPVDGFDWYRILYTYLSPGVVSGGDGWVSSGPRTSPWLAPPADGPSESRSFAGAAGTGPGVVGPIEIGDFQGVEWAAVGQACPLVVSIEDVVIVSTRVDGFAEGEVRLSDDFPELVGTFDIEIETECAWTLSHGI